MNTAIRPRPARGGAVSLFDRYGGLSALRTVILDFYDRALESDVIGPYFDEVDMARLIDHQTKFFSAVLGGPADFPDERLARAHRHLGLSHEEFDEAARILSETLQAAGFRYEDRESVIAAVAARRPLIVTQ